MEGLTEFLKINSGSGDGSGYSSGYGYGEGYGDGEGYGSGSGSGSGSVYGDGEGSGYVYGDGEGYGSSEGSGYGCGSGEGYGHGYVDVDGYGDGDGSGLKSINGMFVYVIDGVQTVITHLKNNIAKGFILNNDLTLTKTYVVKRGNSFAHGSTLRKAMRDVIYKDLQNKNVEEKIEEFKNKFKPNVKYLGQDFFKWHGILTGSCEFGRESFVRDNEINLKDKFTVKEFLKMCEGAYGWEVLKDLLAIEEVE